MDGFSVSLSYTSSGFTKLIDYMAAAVAQDEQVGERLWLSANFVLPVTTIQKSQLLCGLVDKLVSQWGKCITIGNPAAILSSHRSTSQKYIV